MQPTSIDLSTLTPDPTTLLAAVGAVGIVLLGVQLAVKGYYIVSDMIAPEVKDDWWYQNHGYRYDAASDEYVRD